MASDNLKIAKLEAKSKRNQNAIELMRIVSGNPILTGLFGLTLNEIAYRTGMYNTGANEVPSSILGGPVWFEIGESLPPAQQKRNLINGFVIAGCTAWALSGVIGSTVSSVGKIASVLK